MRTKRFHGLKRIKIRQTWNKHNLYNLSRLRLQNTLNPTFYQQKWTAKSSSRAYHGEQIKEGQWERLFSSKIRSVVPMDHKYLASQDGSEQAEGRGSGKDIKPQVVDGFLTTVKKQLPTPYMHMTYAPAERRLDTAIFRALFASSARQARQFVVHGGVKVNGKKMIYPGYLLNPGDMFQVDPDRVMFATGEPKSSDIDQVRKGRSLRKQRADENRNKAARAIKLAEKAKNPRTAASASRSRPKPAVKPEVSEEEKAAIEAERRGKVKEVFQELMAKSKSIQSQTRDAPSANRKRELRSLQNSVSAALKKIRNKDISELESEMDELMSQMQIASRPVGVSAEDAKDDAVASSNQGKDPRARARESSSPKVKTNLDEITPEERRALKEMLRDVRENPIDPSKPYATPWKPRPYMSAFAFIPRYLEVNHNICSAVYLRHPVARPGLAEVPTPFGYETSQLAFTWYLRRR